MNDKKTPPMQSLEEAFQALDVGGQDFIHAMREIQNVQQALLHHETERLRETFGSDDPRVEQYQESIRLNRQHIEELEYQFQVANIKVPSVENGSALLHGRVVDEAHRGHPGLAIVMESEDGKLLRTYGTAKTDTTGYYALSLSAEVVSKHAEGKLDLAYVAVHDRKGNALYRAFEPFSIQASERQALDIVIPRSDLGITHTPPTTSKKPPPQDKESPPQKETWLVKGRVVYEDKTPLVGAMVSAIDKDVKTDDAMGSALTNAKGRFKIVYNPQEFREGLEPGPDLYLEVRDSQGEVVHSTIEQIRENASPDESFNIVLKGEGQYDPDETLPTMRRMKKDDPDKKDTKKR